MKRRPRAAPTFALMLVAAVFSALGVLGCSEDGATPACPAVPLYDIGAAGERNAAEEAREAAVDAGCQTDIDRPEPGATE